jgi:hypothetical protein
VWNGFEERMRTEDELEGRNLFSRHYCVWRMEVKVVARKR